MKKLGFESFVAKKPSRKGLKHYIGAFFDKKRGVK
jgi:hypothetical protein